MSLESMQKEVLTKTGRNIMLYQKVEYLLKLIIPNSSFSGYVNELISNKEKKAVTLKKKTMGHLVSEYIEIINPEYQETSNEAEEFKEGFFSFRHYVGSVFHKTIQDTLVTIVSDRNELVHHLFYKFDVNTLEGCTQIGNELDTQKDKILFAVNLLSQLANGLQKIADILGSDEAKKRFELFYLRQSILVDRLAAISVNIARPDGWASINTANRLVNKDIPEEISSIKQKYGYHSLKDLIAATEIFDIYEEPTEKGFRVLYKLRLD